MAAALHDEQRSNRIREVQARDQVDLVVEHWKGKNPALDTVTKTLALRLRRVARHLERELRRELATSGTELWELEMLLELYRAPSACLGAGDLLRSSPVTSGAITNRVARLEDRGWVRREVDPQDRRMVRVSLTSSGKSRAKELIAAKTGSEERFFAAIDRWVVERMTDDLRTMLLSIEGPGDEQRPD